MTAVKIEGWDKITGWHFGGFYDLDTAEGEQAAKEAFIQMSKRYGRARYVRVYESEILNPN